MQITIVRRLHLQIPNNGRYSKYRLGSSFEVGVKNVGGTDTGVPAAGSQPLQGLAKELDRSGIESLVKRNAVKIGTAFAYRGRQAR